MATRRDINEVFTPRSSTVNPRMYVARDELEIALHRSIKKNIHTLLHGESGNGKSWLYKKVLADKNIPFKIANCANALTRGSIREEIYHSIVETGTPIKTGYKENIKAGIGVGIASAGVDHNAQYELTKSEFLLEAFKVFKKKHGKAKKIIVLDNLECIYGNQVLMDELANIIILLDDEKYARYNVNLLIVGVPSGVLEYFAKTKNLEPVANRIEEVRKVGGLSNPMVTWIMKQGFKQFQVSITVGNRQKLVKHIVDITLGIAQRVHEYGEAIGYSIEDNNWKYNADLIQEADKRWLVSGLRSSYQVIEGHLNSRATEVQRKNQIIFVVGKITKHEFDSNLIDSRIRKEFPGTIPKTNMGIAKILSELSDTINPLIKKNPKTNFYSVCDPRYLMCIRLMLYKESISGKIIKRTFST